MNPKALFVAARILIPGVFVGLGSERLLLFAGIIPGAAVSAGAAAFSVFELLLGIAIMIGWHVRWTAGVMAAFIVVDAFMAHSFWTYPSAEQHGQLLHFLKNLSALGGLLLLIGLDLSQSRSGKA